MTEQPASADGGFDAGAFAPTPSTWFAPSVEYAGRGRAEFEGSDYGAEGPVTARMDDSDRPSVEMVVEKPDAALFVDGKLRRCLRLVVDTPGGVLHADGPRVGFSASSDSVRLRFKARVFTFEAAGAGPARYWAVPLLNFVDPLHDAPPDLDRHPLRVFPTPVVPGDLPEREQRRARFAAGAENRLAFFRYNGGWAFIERLPDAEERVAALDAQGARHLATAVLVGEVGANPTDGDAWHAWFPYDFLYLIGLATGVEVGAHWVEFRDADGALVRRVHVGLGTPVFHRGTVVLPHWYRGALGHLLTEAQASPHFGQPHLRVAVRRATRAGMDILNLEERWSHLIQAFEGLTTFFKVDTQNLMDGFSPEQRAAVTDILRAAARDIGRVPAPRDQRQRIADRARGATQKDKDFGLALGDLLRLDPFRLTSDAAVVEAYYRANPRPDGRNTLAALLSFLRGAVFHEGYFDLEEGGAHDRDDVFTLMRHLHDLLVRVVLKRAGYTGNYHPVMAVEESTLRPLDWVNGDTPPGELGYGREIA